MGRRSRKARPGAKRPIAPREREPAAHVAAPPDGGDRMARGYARGRQRDEAARAKLEPLAPGERPLAVTIGALLALAVGIANLVLYLAGWQVQGQDPQLGGALVVCAVFLLAAYGMWRVRYWAVLGFEVLLGVSFTFAFLALLRAANFAAVAQCLIGMAITGPLFYFLIRQMARIQMPERT